MCICAIRSALDNWCMFWDCNRSGLCCSSEDLTTNNSPQHKIHRIYRRAVEEGEEVAVVVVVVVAVVVVDYSFLFSYCTHTNTFSMYKRLVKEGREVGVTCSGSFLQMSLRNLHAENFRNMLGTKYNPFYQDSPCTYRWGNSRTRRNKLVRIGPEHMCGMELDSLQQTSLRILPTLKGHYTHRTRCSLQLQRWICTCLLGSCSMCQ